MILFALTQLGEKEFSMWPAFEGKRECVRKTGRRASEGDMAYEDFPLSSSASDHSPKHVPQCQEGFGSGLEQSAFIRVSLGSPRTPLASLSQVQIRASLQTGKMVRGLPIRHKRNQVGHTARQSKWTWEGLAVSLLQ